MVRAEDLKVSLDRSGAIMTLYGKKQWVFFFTVAANETPSVWWKRTKDLE